MHPKGLQARNLLLASGVAVLALLLRIPLLRIPFERDEGGYAYIAWRLFFGELPYRDWFDQKPPGIFWTYGAAMALPIDPVVAIHAAASLFVAASSFALFCLVRQFAGTTEALLSAVVFLLLAADPGMQGNAANTEVFMAPPVLLAHWLFVAAPLERRWTWLGVGVLLGLATAYKQVAGVNVVFFAAVVVLRAGRGERLADLSRFVLWCGLGGLVPWLGIVAVFAVQGAAGDLLRDVFLHNLAYVGALPVEVRGRALARTLGGLVGSQGVVWLVALLGTIALLRHGGEQRRAALYLAGWIATGAVGVQASGYFFPHYFQQLSAPIAILAGLAAGQLIEAGRPRSRLRAALRVGIPLALTLQLAASIYPFLVRYTPQQAVRAIYPGNRFDLMPMVAERVREISRPEDAVFVFGASPEILFYAERRSATRYIYLFSLYGPYAGALEEQQATAAEVAAARPAVVLFIPNRLFFMRGAPQYLTSWTRAWLDAEYQLDSVIALDRSGEGFLADATTRLPPGSGRGRIYVRRSAD